MTSTIPTAPLCLLCVVQLPFTTPTGTGFFQLFSSNTSSYLCSSIHPIISWSPSPPLSLPSLLFCTNYLPHGSHASSAVLSHPWLPLPVQLPPTFPFHIWARWAYCLQALITFPVFHLHPRTSNLVSAPFTPTEIKNRWTWSDQRIL